MGKAAIGNIGPPKPQKPAGAYAAKSPLKTKTNPLRTTPRQTTGKLSVLKLNLKPTPMKNTQPAALRGQALSVAGMKKLAQGRAGRVVKGALKKMRGKK